VNLEGLILKPNMVLAGKDCPQQPSVDEVADATVQCLLRTAPAAVPGVAFLSGGQSAELASARLNAMHVRWQSRLPWTLTYSYSRAIQQPALDLWKGVEGNVKPAQEALYFRAKLNGAASLGKYKPEMEAA
jgi:fructose-bisphosphate aldolase class I